MRATSTNLFALAACVLLALAACSPEDTGETSPPAQNEEVPVPEEPVTEKPAASPDAEGATCGGLSGAPCPAGLYCQQPDGQCLEVMDGSGTCERVPEACTQEFAPVCGCDGQTYGNACEAAAAGASVAAEGECAGVDVE